MTVCCATQVYQQGIARIGRRTRRPGAKAGRSRASEAYDARAECPGPGARPSDDEPGWPTSRKGGHKGDHKGDDPTRSVGSTLVPASDAIRSNLNYRHSMGQLRPLELAEAGWILENMLHGAATVAPPPPPLQHPQQQRARPRGPPRHIKRDSLGLPIGAPSLLQPWRRLDANAALALAAQPTVGRRRAGGAGNGGGGGGDNSEMKWTRSESSRTRGGGPQGGVARPVSPRDVLTTLAAMLSGDGKTEGLRRK